MVCHVHSISWHALTVSKSSERLSFLILILACFATIANSHSLDSTTIRQQSDNHHVPCPEGASEAALSDCAKLRHPVHRATYTRASIIFL